MIFTHNIMLFIFPTITHKMAKISDPYKRGHLLVPSRIVIELPCYQNTPQNPKTLVPGSKLNLNLVLDCPKTVLKIMSGLFENSPKNSTRTVQKQSQNLARIVRKQFRKFLKIPTLNSKNLGLKFTTSKQIPSH